MNELLFIFDMSLWATVWRIPIAGCWRVDQTKWNNTWWCKLQTKENNGKLLLETKTDLQNRHTKY